MLYSFENVEKEVTSSGEISGNYMEEWNMLDPKDRLNLGLGVPRIQHEKWHGGKNTQVIH